MITEQQYQTNVKEALEAKGYYVLNLMKTNKSGIADLLALKSKKAPIFIEVKGLRGVIAPLQEYRALECKERGFTHYFTFVGDNFLTQIIHSL
jgi:Holliday junction resolvase-like predicted endonuclease